MKAVVVRQVDGQFTSTEYAMDDLIPSMSALGFEVTGFVDEPHLVPYLQKQPRFAGFIGPMGSNGDLRYEDHPANDFFSK